MTTQKTTFENKPYSALYFNGPCENRNVGIKLYFRYQLFIFVNITWYHPRPGGGGGGGVRGKYLMYHQSVE